VLPNLFVIGAGKAGTSSLHYYLDQHPDIYMSRVKEPYFFERADWREKIGWYESLFPKPTALRGESSTSYSAYPVRPDVPRRIRELTPDAKLIYIVRDPIDRIAAHYAQHLGRGLETRSLAEAVQSALSDGDDPVNPYLCMSRYATQVEQYLQHFPLERIHVIDQVDLQRKRAHTLRAVFRFLGVDDSFNSPAFTEVLNTQADQVRFNRLGTLLRFSRPAQLIEQRVPRNLRIWVTKPLIRLLSEPVERPTFSDELHERLTGELRPEVERLRELTGMQFADWSL
jgi:hypothetical protein